MRAAVLTLALAALLAGCGGSSHRAATTTPRRPSPSALLQRYLDAMGKHERRFDTLSERVVETVDALDLIRPSKDWPAAARRLGPVTTGFDRLGVDISKVKPPSPLLDVHVKLAEATVSFGEYVFNLQQALAAQLPAQLALAAEADTMSIRVARREWAKAVTLYAAKLGVTPPEWLVPSPAG